MKKNQTPTKTFLDEAKAIDYGSVTQNFTRIAKMWSAILDTDVTPEQVALCMCATKIARQCHKHKDDNIVDLMGYAATIEKMNNENK